MTGNVFQFRTFLAEISTRFFKLIRQNQCFQLRTIGQSKVFYCCKIYRQINGFKRSVVEERGRTQYSNDRVGKSISGFSLRVGYQLCLDK